MADTRQAQHDRLPLPLPRQAALRPDHAALVVDGAAVSYADLARRVDLCARRLARCGVGAGDRVAVCLPNGARFVEILHAIARLGAVLVPLNTRLAFDELTWQLGDSDPRVVVWDPAYADRLPSTAERPVLMSAESRGEPDVLAAPPLDSVKPSDVTLLDTVHLDAPFTIVYTSGTTGRPKGVVLTHGNHLWSALGSALRLGVEPDDRWLAPLPWFHVGGLGVLLRSSLYGTTAVLPGRSDAEGIAATLRGDAITLVSLVPTMLARLLDAWGDKAAPTSLRAVLLGGAPASSALLARAASAGFPLARTYGLTEACSQVATERSGASSATSLTMPPLPFTTVRVVQDNGADVDAPGDEGRVLVGGPTVMAGYWNDPEATSAALQDGWLRTNDVGALDASGDLRIGGRLDDTIVTGGENVHPAEVEAVLGGHPGVAECCVVGEPDVEWGQAVAAVVVRDPDAATSVTEADLDSFVREGLAGYKAPRRYVWSERALPRTSTGKISRRTVMDLLLA